MEQASLDTITLHVPKYGDDPSHLEFRDTSFFKSANSNLPSAAEVLQQHGKDSESFYGIAIFQELGLLVKFGQPSYVQLDNALTMRALWQAFPNRDIPVPEESPASLIRKRQDGIHHIGNIRYDNEMTAVGEYWSWRGYP
ncbi:hypothetical protein LA080_003191 [Diaporthe eres]|nr:hypothetical protein LA080_003191 [Diaporthe eres]